jgi:excisionase family DNA binding protein
MLSKSVNITPALLRVNEAASYLAVSERTFWSLLKAQRIPAVRFGKTVRIDRSDLDAFIQTAKGGR